MIEREYGIKTKPDSSGIPQSNAIIKIIHQVLGNLVQTYNLYKAYVNDSDPWMVILTAYAYTVLSMCNHTKGKSPVQLVLVQDIILPINHIVDYKFICQR